MRIAIGLANKNDEPCSNTIMKLFALGPPSDAPLTFLEYLQASKRPAISDMLELRQKDRLHSTD